MITDIIHVRGENVQFFSCRPLAGAASAGFGGFFHEAKRFVQRFQRFPSGVKPYADIRLASRGKHDARFKDGHKRLYFVHINFTLVQQEGFALLLHFIDPESGSAVPQKRDIDQALNGRGGR